MPVILAKMTVIPMMEVVSMNLTVLVYVVVVLISIFVILVLVEQLV